MVSLSALIQRFSKDGTAPTGVRKHVGVSGAVTMTVSTLGGTSYAKHPVPDRQTTLMPPVSPLSSTLATTPEGWRLLKKASLPPLSRSLSVNLYLSFEHQCWNSFHKQKNATGLLLLAPRPKWHGRVAWGPPGRTAGGRPCAHTAYASAGRPLRGPPANCQKTRWNDNEQYYPEWGQG